MRTINSSKPSENTGHFAYLFLYVSFCLAQKMGHEPVSAHARLGR